MIDGLKPYPEYRPSAHPWLGDVPAHWIEKRAKYFYREVDERSTTGEEELMSVSHKTGVTPRKAHVTMFMAESNVGHKVCRPDDLVINTMWAFMAALGVARQVGVVSPSYGVYRPNGSKELNPDYVDRLLRIEDYKSEYLCRSTGIRSSRLRLYPDQFLRIPILCPPPEEQAAIVRFLDHVDRRVRRYIRAKRQLIALLNEQKQAIIHRAVTRGLDPNVKLKPSGIEWLGDVPEHWSLKRFKFVTKIASGQVDPRLPVYRDQILIAPNHIEIGTGRILCEETADEQGADSGKYQVKSGQIIYSKIRPNLQKATIAPFDCLCSADMYPITPSPSDFVPEYFLRLLLSKPVTKYTVDCSMRVAMPKINRDALGECWLWFPNKSEQQQIVDFLQSELQPYSALVQTIQNGIAQMREYQLRLTRDVVIGLYDVRQLAEALNGTPEMLIDADDVLEFDFDEADSLDIPEEVEV